MLAGTTSSTMSRLGIEFLSALLTQHQTQGECWWDYIGIAASNPASVGGRKTPIVNSHRSRRLVFGQFETPLKQLLPNAGGTTWSRVRVPSAPIATVSRSRNSGGRSSVGRARRFTNYLSAGYYLDVECHLADKSLPNAGRVAKFWRRG